MTRFSPTRTPAVSSHDPRAGRLRRARRPLRHRGPLQRAAQPAGPPGDLPGRRLRRRPRIRRRIRGRDLQPARHPGGGPGVLRRRQGPARRRTAATRDELLVLPAATFVLGDTEAEAAGARREVRRQQVSGQTAIKFAEQLWNRDLSDYDPDGPLPEFDPLRRREHHRPGPGQRPDVHRSDRHRPRSGGNWPRPRGSRCAR